MTSNKWRINGLGRLALVLTTILAAASYWNETGRLDQIRKSEYEIGYKACLLEDTSIQKTSSCANSAWNAAWADYEKSRSDIRKVTAAVFVFAWTLLWAVMEFGVAVLRWVVRGFREEEARR